MEFGAYIQTAEKDIQNWMGVCIVAFGIWTSALLFYCLFVVQEKRISAHLISVSFIDDIQYFMNEGYDTLSIQFYSISHHSSLSCQIRSSVFCHRTAAHTPSTSGAQATNACPLPTPTALDLHFTQGCELGF